MGALSLFDLFTYCFREGCATMKSNSVAVSLFLTSCFCAVVLSAPQPASIPRVVRYIRDAAPEDYVRVKRAHPSQTTYFSLALPQKNVHVLLDKLTRISNPKNAEYGKWLTKKEVYDLIGTPDHIVQEVRNWLHGNGPGLHRAVFTGDSFLVTCSAHYAERLFNTELHEFYNYDFDTTAVKHLGELSLPEHLDAHVELVTGVTDFSPAPLRPRKPSRGPMGSFNPCNTPPSLRALYNMTDADVANSSVSQAPFANLASPEGFGAQSLQTFQEQCGIANNPVNRTLGSGAYSPHYDDGEANLDMELITTFGVGATTDFFIVDPSKGWMYEYTQEYLTTSNPSMVNSMSYAWNEDQQCKNESIPFVGQCQRLHIPNSKVYVNRTSTEFAKITAMGNTFLAASGDGGTNGNHGGDSCRYTHPLFPAASPYVVSVGATVAVPGSHRLPGNYSEPICQGHGAMSCTCSRAAHEVLCMNTNYGGFDSGGGFSYFALRPSYQDDAVTEYLNSNVTLPPEGTYHSAGRAYPDVAAVGGNIAVIVQGTLDLTGGTSASTPLWAGIISTLNSMRMANGKSQLGFVNPVLYQAAEECPDCFQDITHGYNNNDCPHPAGTGFYAAPGWDPTTGLGSPNFAALKDYIVNQIP